MAFSLFGAPTPGAAPPPGMRAKTVEEQRAALAAWKSGTGVGMPSGGFVAMTPAELTQQQPAAPASGGFQPAAAPFAPIPTPAPLAPLMPSTNVASPAPPAAAPPAPAQISPLQMVQAPNPFGVNPIASSTPPPLADSTGAVAPSNAVDNGSPTLPQTGQQPAGKGFGKGPSSMQQPQTGGFGNSVSRFGNGSGFGSGFGNSQSFFGQPNTQQGMSQDFGALLKSFLGNGLMGGGQ